MRLPSGKWLGLSVIPGTFLNNGANIMRRGSNDRRVSTPHRVLNQLGADYYWIAYYHSRIWTR